MYRCYDCFAFSSVIITSRMRMIFLCSSVGKAASFSDISELAVEVDTSRTSRSNVFASTFKALAMETNVSNFGNLNPHSKLLKYFGVDHLSQIGLRHTPCFSDKLDLISDLLSVQTHTS